MDWYPVAGGGSTRETYEDEHADGEFDQHTVRVLGGQQPRRHRCAS